MSGISGFPTTQKILGKTGDTQKSKADFVTLQPSFDSRQALDTVPRFAFRVGAIRTAQAGTGNLDDGKGTYIADTATTAREGDIVRFETGNMQYFEAPIVEVQTNGFRLGIRVASAYAPASTDTFYILRYATQLVDSSGSPIVSTTPGPTQFVLNSVNTQVLKDTTTPANNKPFPVQLEPGRAGSFDEITNLTNSAQSFTAPARAVGFKIQSLSDNAQNIRMKVGAAATASSGFRLEPGRSESFDLVGTISVIAEAAGTNYVCVQWILEA